MQNVVYFVRPNPGPDAHAAPIFCSSKAKMTASNYNQQEEEEAPPASPVQHKQLQLVPVVPLVQVPVTLVPVQIV